MVMCQELRQILDDSLDESEISVLKKELQVSLKCEETRVVEPYFVYMLMDPRISRNIPHIVNEARTFDERAIFEAFIRSIFYVGAGNLNQAVRDLRDAKRVYTANYLETTRKLAYIGNIWDSGYGVVVLPCAQNISVKEALTRKALLVDTLGHKGLTNRTYGGYFGAATDWSLTEKRLIGACLLRGALDVLLEVGECQQFPDDVAF